jgi:hypothetical protein
MGIGWEDHGNMVFWYDKKNVPKIDPVVASERKWDWGIIYSNLEG